MRKKSGCESANVKFSRCSSIADGVVILGTGSGLCVLAYGIGLAIWACRVPVRTMDITTTLLLGAAMSSSHEAGCQACAFLGLGGVCFILLSDEEDSGCVAVVKFGDFGGESVLTKLGDFLVDISGCF